MHLHFTICVQNDDKRGYTGNMVVNGVGQLLFTVMTTAGKTEASMPSAGVRADFEDTMFTVSPNHWSNHDIQVKLLVRTWQWVVADYASDHGCDLDEAAREVKCLHILDCWPVNITDRLRSEVAEKCPGMTLMFVPAGYTGQKQVFNII